MIEITKGFRKQEHGFTKVDKDLVVPALSNILRVSNWKIYFRHYASIATIFISLETNNKALVLITKLNLAKTNYILKVMFL